MNITDVRDALDGMNRKDVISQDLIKSMKRANLVIAYCPDNMRVWVFGAVTGNLRINKGFIVSHEGITMTESDEDAGFLRALRDANRDDVGPVRLSFETNSPHEVFSVLEDDEMFSLGVVLDLNNL